MPNCGPRRPSETEGDLMFKFFQRIMPGRLGQCDAGTERGWQDATSHERPPKVGLWTREMMLLSLAILLGGGFVWGRLQGSPATPKALLKRHTGTVMCLAFSPDGKTIATGGVDGIIRLWDGKTGRFEESLPTRRDPVRCLAFSPDGKTLASGAWDGS